MKVLPKEIEARLRDQLAAERELRARELADLLTEARRLEDWRAAEIPEGLRNWLGERRAELGVDLLELLADWTRRGGEVLFQAPGPKATLPQPVGLPVTVAPAPPPVVSPPPFASPPPVASRPPPAPPPSPQLPAEEAETISDATIPGVHIAALNAAASAPKPVERARGKAVIAPPPVASRESLEALVAKLKPAPAAPPPAAPTRDWRLDLGAVLAALDLPAEDDEQEAARLNKVIHDADRWKPFPKDVQRDLVGLCATRLRRLQDERGYAGIDDHFSTLSGWSKREQPGFVNGLSRGHHPHRATWSDDADAYYAKLSVPSVETPKPNVEKILRELQSVSGDLAAPIPEVQEAVRAQFRRLVREALEAGASARDPRLVRMVSGHLDLFDGAEFKALRRHARDDAEADAEESAEGEGKATAIPEDWKWWGRTRGRRGVLVGGDPREPNRIRLQDAFGFSELDWMPTEFRRNSLQAVRDRVRAGKTDIVVILGAFVGHDADEVILPACRDMGVDWVHLDKGYGVVRLKRAIERFLEPIS